MGLRQGAEGAQRDVGAALLAAQDLFGRAVARHPPIALHLRIADLRSSVGTMHPSDVLERYVRAKLEARVGFPG